MSLSARGWSGHPFLYCLEYSLDKVEHFAQVQTVHDQIVLNATHPVTPRLGNLCYCFSRVHGDPTSRKLWFTEILADSSCYLNHISENEVDSVMEMYEKGFFSIENVAVFNPPEQDELAMANIHALALDFSLQSGRDALFEEKKTQKPKCGFFLNYIEPGGSVFNTNIVNGKLIQKFPDMKPRYGKSILLEFHLEPILDGKEKLEGALRSLTSSLVGKDGYVISAFASKAWWKCVPPFSHSNAYGAIFVIPYAQGATSFFPKARLSELKSYCSSIDVAVTTCLWEHQDVDFEEFIEHLALYGFPVSQKREVFSGYLLHPAFCKDWSGSAPESMTTQKSEVSLSVSSTKTKEMSTLTATSNAFSIRRNPITNQAEALVFSTTDIAPTDSKMGKVIVPIRLILTKLIRLGRTDKEIPIGIVYSGLERLRSIKRDAIVFNSVSDEEIENDSELVILSRRFLETLNALGISLGCEKRLPVEFAQLNELIQILESEFVAHVQNGIEATKRGTSISYMGLQEYYRIGSLVITRQMGCLSGELCCFQVSDSFFEPRRGLTGGRKYSFNIVLECILLLGGEFVSVKFPFIFEEWNGVKPISELPFKSLKGHPTEGDLVKLLKSRSSILEQCRRVSYLHYSSNCFFPHSSSRNIGGTSSILKKTSSGKIIVDTSKGLDLGHSPVATIDELGLAVAAVTKEIRNITRSISNSESDSKQKVERYESAGIKTWKNLPSYLQLLCWPSVVGFSLTSKRWGHVLVDGLSTVDTDSIPWNQLILPSGTKEMLLALVKSSDRSSKFRRYRYRDVVESKGSGILFLLYGSPGTGKTLSVEALCSLLGRPLYSVSFAELGSSVSDLEERLTDVLSLAAHWGAIVLLDEGDALVEKRKPGQFQLNSMTGILLRLLESFDGILFITSNRVSSFDPAALSRVTLAIRYEKLEGDSKVQIWRNSLARVISDADPALPMQKVYERIDAQFELTELGKFHGSGRSVGSVMRLAIALCEERQKELDQDIMNDAIAVYESFNHELVAQGATESWDS